LRDLGAEVADRRAARVGDARPARVLGLPAPGRERQAQDPWPERREALRRRGPGGAADPGGGRRARGARERGGGRGVNLHARVLRALDTVIDPELDEPVTTLGFVGSCVAGEQGDVSVRLRLPTPQCAPNFAFLMAADAQAAIARVPGVKSVRVELEDHFTGREINAAVAEGDGFGDAF